MKSTNVEINSKLLMSSFFVTQKFLNVLVVQHQAGPGLSAVALAGQILEHSDTNLWVILLQYFC